MMYLYNYTIAVKYLFDFTLMFWYNASKNPLNSLDKDRERHIISSIQQSKH